ncbi:MAG: alpha/beta fold hydrolase, partial [Caulobacteraceae bacterium]|nr:alpha/beta fold hydrolase [Caulobacteraceae bacterium]
FDNFVDDLRQSKTLPTQVDKRPFVVGENMAVTPGAVIFRNEFFELIQYNPGSSTVYQRPLLVVPPPIGKYYFLDLAPGRSFFEFAVDKNIHLFTISWRNPGNDQSDWNLDTYAGGVLEALDVVKTVSGSPDVNALGFCAGGMLLATVLNHLKATDQTPIHTAAFAVTLLDFDTEAPIGAYANASLLEAGRGASAQRGVLDAKTMAAVFAWLRPNDLVWNYWVNNYLMGEEPPAVDLMAWNADGTNLPGALHAQFLEIFGRNVLCQPGAMTVLGTPVDLGRIDVELYCMAAINDHLTPWRGCYRTTQLLGSPSTFVLSNSGHIAGLVNPPGNPKSKYFLGPSPPPAEADDWLANASERPGTWWEHWAEWTTRRSGDLVSAPAAPGGDRYPPIDAAPGRYIHG